MDNKDFKLGSDHIKGRGGGEKKKLTQWLKVNLVTNFSQNYYGSFSEIRKIIQIQLNGLQSKQASMIPG